eukprot:1193824-Prorocentrum_minimum.AAC.1
MEHASEHRPKPAFLTSRAKFMGCPLPIWCSITVPSGKVTARYSRWPSFSNISCRCISHVGAGGSTCGKKVTKSARLLSRSLSPCRSRCPPPSPLYHTVPYHAVTALYCALLHQTTMLYCTIPYCTVLYRTVEEGDPGGGGLQGTRPRAWQLGGPASRGLLYCTVVYCIRLYHTVLYIAPPARPRPPEHN